MDRTDHERLAVIEEVVLRLEERLLGNGQPGEITIIKERVRKLESWLWRAAGACGLLAAALELFDHPLARLAGK